MVCLRTRGMEPRKGQVVIFLAVSIVAIISTIAISLDGGAITSERRHAQATADSAALAAASQLYYDYWLYNGVDPQGTAKAAALAAAAKNGYANDGTTTTVTVNIPPTSGNYVGRAGYVEVIVQYNYPRGFSSIFSSDTIPVIARAVAVGAPIAANVGILVLDPSAKDAFSAGGGGKVNVYDTPIVVDSVNAEGSIANGGTIVNAPDYYLVGSYATAGGGQFIGTMHTNSQPMQDPFQYLPVPDPSTMTVQSHKSSQYTQGSTTLQPGVYKGGISASGSASITLIPGIYYMDGGGFSFSGQGNLIGNGVMIYNAPGNGNSGGISVTGQGTITLSGMTSGIYQGMTFWQDRTSNVTGTISGTSGTTSITGTFYFAGALLNVSGNGGVVNVGSQYVSKDLNLGGNGTINIQWTPYTVGRRRMITIVE